MSDELIHDPYDRRIADQAAGPGPAEFNAQNGDHEPPPGYYDPPDPERLVFDGHIAAPGYGIAYHDPVTGVHWVKIGANFCRADEGPYELSPEDVI